LTKRGGFAKIKYSLVFDKGGAVMKKAKRDAEVARALERFGLNPVPHKNLGRAFEMTMEEVRGDLAIEVYYGTITGILFSQTVHGSFQIHLFTSLATVAHHEKWTEVRDLVCACWWDPPEDKNNQPKWRYRRVDNGALVDIWEFRFLPQ
jgi:hypothetical protein